MLIEEYAEYEISMKWFDRIILSIYIFWNTLHNLNTYLVLSNCYSCKSGKQKYLKTSFINIFLFEMSF